MKRSGYAVFLAGVVALSAMDLRAQNIARPYPFTMPSHRKAAAAYLPNLADVCFVGAALPDSMLTQRFLTLQ